MERDRGESVPAVGQGLEGAKYAIVQNLFVKIGADFDGNFRTASSKATGKTLDAQVCHVFKFRDGEVTSFQQFEDTAQMQDVMGAR